MKEMDSQNPPLTRKLIAERLGVTPAYVTQVLGPKKKYKPRVKS